MLNLPSVQNYAKELVVTELKNKLGTELGIAKLHFQPFNSVELDSVYLYDQSNEKVLLAQKLSASIDLFALANKKVVITSAKLSDFDIHLSKENSEAPLNIQYIIDAFKSKEDKPKQKFEVKLNSINISNGNFSYDVKDKPTQTNKLDANHIKVSDFHAKLALKSLTSDSINIKVKKISLKEKSGLTIDNLSFRLITKKEHASLRGFRLDMPSSTLELDRCEVELKVPNDTAKVIDYAKLDCIIASSDIAPKDISALVPELQNFKDKLYLRGKINGTLNHLNIADLSIDYGETMQLTANAEIKNIKDRSKTYIKGGIGKLRISSTEIESLINNFSKTQKALPNQLHKLGLISFTGDVSGLLSDLTAFGTIDTDLGSIKTDVLLNISPNPKTSFALKGKVSTSSINLGELLENKDLNQTSLDIHVELIKPVHGKINGKAEGTIFDFDYKNYTYKNITLDASYDGMRVDGHLNIDDLNGKLGISGLFDLSDKEKPELKFKARIENVQLDDLHIANNMKHSYLSMVIDADFTGRNIDNMEGFLRVDSIDFIREDKNFQMDQLLIESSCVENQRKLKITSDLINGDINGAYSFSSMFNSIQQTLHPYLPAIIKEGNKKRPDEKENNLLFDFKINNSESLSSILNLPVTVISPAKIVGAYNNINDKFKVEIFTPAIKAAGMNIKSGYIAIENPDDSVKAKIDLLVVGKNNAINDISIKSKLCNNLVNTHISLANDGKQKAKGEFSIATLFSRNDKKPLQIDFDILPSELILNNALWKMDKSHIKVYDNTYAVDNFFIYNEDGSQELRVNGKYNNKSSIDILQAELRNINLEYVFQTLAIDVLKFGGAATGRVFVSSIEKKPYLNTRLEITNFKFNGTELGKLNLFSELDEETNKVMLDGLIVSKENKETTVKGSIDPVKQGLSINFDADSIDIGFLNTYAASVFDKVEGRGTGNVHLFGDFSDVTVEGKAFIEKGKIGIKFLNTEYTFTDTIFLKKDLIYFNDVIFSDQHNNQALMSGKVAHDYFHDFMYQVNMSANNFLVFNATKEQNPFFYGKVFGSGKGTLGGDEKSVDIDISMKTEDKTIVRMNFMEDVVNEYSFITYKSDIAEDTTATTRMPGPITTDSGMDINMNFYIDATPDALVELIMDPVGGDVLRGSGSGAMQFQWNTKSSPRLYGTYNISRGSYNFTFQRLMEKRFSILDGSSVQFRGDPFEATLDVNAVYKVTASLRDLDNDIANKTGQSTVPVNCVLNLTGPLKHPNVGLDIQFPSADPEVARQVKSLINTEDMISKQVTYLLLLSKFYTFDRSKVTDGTSDFAAVASATLSNQLTKIVSQIDDRWQLGTNIRYSDTKLTNTEVELILSSRLLNDRLLINGNFGYRENIESSSNTKNETFIGDVDIEYLLNNAGSWRVKAYNHYNEKYFYDNIGNSQTQGIGIIYKKDFDKFKDIFIDPDKKKRNKKDTIAPIIPDSTKKGSSLSHFIKLKK